MINGLTRRGVPLLLVVLPDGSRSLIPSAWTDGFVSFGANAPETVKDGEDLCAVGDLIKARAVIDALLNRLAESAPGEEGNHAVGVGVSRTAHGAGAPHGGAPHDDPGVAQQAIDLFDRVLSIRPRACASACPITETAKDAPVKTPSVPLASERIRLACKLPENARFRKS